MYVCMHVCMYVCATPVISESDGTITVSYSPGSSKTFAGFLRRFEPVTLKDVCMNECMYVSMRVCMSVCMYVYVRN